MSEEKLAALQRKVRFEEINQMGAIGTDKLRQEAVTDYESLRQYVVEIDRVLADPELKMSPLKRVKLRLLSLAIDLRLHVDATSDDITLLFKGAEKEIYSVQREESQKKVSELLAEIKDYQEYILDPRYPKRLNGVFALAQEEAIKVSAVAKEIFLMREANKVNPHSIQDKSSSPYFSTKSAEIEAKLASGELQPTRGDYQRAFNVQKIINETAFTLAKNLPYNFDNFELYQKKNPSPPPVIPNSPTPEK